MFRPAAHVDDAAPAPASEAIRGPFAGDAPLGTLT